MTGLLSREKEFHKLNEQLNKLATTDRKDSHDLHQNRRTTTTSTTSATGTYQSSGIKLERYNTYTKTKGCSTFLRTRGAGDCLSDIAGPQSATNNKARERQSSNLVNTHTNTNNDYHRCGRLSSMKPTIPTSRPDSHEANLTVHPTKLLKSSRKPYNETCSQHKNNSRSVTLNTNNNCREKDKSTSDKCPMQMISGNHNAKHTRLNDNSTRSFPMRTNSFRNGHPHTGLTVKYHNPKFIESPSLDNFVKEQCASLSSPKNNNKCNSKQLSTDGMIKFLKSKITILELDNDRLTEEITRQKELLEKTLDRHRQDEQQRDQAIVKTNFLAEQLNKSELQMCDTSRRYKELKMEYVNHMKHMEGLKRDMKILTQTNTNLEKRLYRVTEELENTKNALAVMKTNEREFKKSLHNETECRDKQIKSLKRQRADLLNAYKKQLFLIDNLKRQNICMQQSKMIGFGEKDFSNVLEWHTAK